MPNINKERMAGGIKNNMSYLSKTNEKTKPKNWPNPKPAHLAQTGNWYPQIEKLRPYI